MTGWIISFRSSLWSQLPGDTNALIEKVLTFGNYLHTCFDRFQWQAWEPVEKSHHFTQTTKCYPSNYNILFPSICIARRQGTCMVCMDSAVCKALLITNQSPKPNKDHLQQICNKNTIL